MVNGDRSVISGRYDTNSLQHTM